MVTKKSRRFKAEVVAAVSALSALLIIGTVSFHLMEKWSWVDSFYFTVVTMATVGYGDLHPTKTGTRLFTAFFILVSVTIALASLGVIGSKYLERRGQKIQSNRNGND